MALQQFIHRLNISVNMENPAPVSKFSISSYFAQIKPLVSYFRKYNSKILKRSSFFKIEESLKIAILAYRRSWKVTKMMHFLFARAGSNVLLIYHSTSLALSKTLDNFWKAVKLVFFLAVLVSPLESLERLS